MSIVTRGFRGRRDVAPDLPPGQYLTHDFPVLSAGPTPRVDHDRWQFTITSEAGARHTWTWRDLLALPNEQPHGDIHCVTKWPKLNTHWKGVSLDVLFDAVDTGADYAVVRSYGGYTTNLPVEDLLDGQAWLVYRYEDDDLTPEHGGPVRLLVAHLYFWKSAKWVKGLELSDNDEPGFRETLGYHNYGDPWREQRYTGD
ncbi:molybdopterin-dependent oxidoreductase [Kibdelosporangium phytohabitans]|uniref:Molybdopterin-binding protein n=1 Tax=Kibdelosporangium phytohabitans TaxID=860235 RepID=A0A0N7F3Z8_9PSEU|nr:molybdopterin-dependent oxidoreductase [Kibdelosporangium phytohabitans]ALG10031.1 molybdopterin-binding protein [Kibdelosporangium phytohabitans]MBE1460997.1 DMSO/TMAO reductase YedYZ molybdopterin-dependent catalytic subunit [Kibdelosporangium phytohabitans]